MAATQSGKLYRVAAEDRERADWLSGFRQICEARWSGQRVDARIGHHHFRGRGQPEHGLSLFPDTELRDDLVQRAPGLVAREPGAAGQRPMEQSRSDNFVPADHQRSSWTNER